MAMHMNRRKFMKESLVLSAGGALAAGLGRSGARADGEKKPDALQASASGGALPQGKIGNLQLSRLIMGSNLITYFAHSRDLNYVSNLARHYNTLPKILETLAIGEQQGINCIAIHSGDAFKQFIKGHREQGGKLQWIIGVEAGSTLQDFEFVIGDVVATGAAALYLHGNASEKLFNNNQIDMIGQVVEAMKKTKLPVGVGCHNLAVLVECEKNKWPIDFYVKTFHHFNYPSAPRPEQRKAPHSENPGYWCQDPQAVMDVMKNCEKAWIGFKVMAAGAIPPKDAFPYCFKNGVDHILAGMFDWQIAEDVKIARQTLDGLTRARPWRS
ncbi:MAG: hypothetical protein ABSE73_23140 [Planctomycetota bacterium]